MDETNIIRSDNLLTTAFLDETTYNVFCTIVKNKILVADSELVARNALKVLAEEVIGGLLLSVERYVHTHRLEPYKIEKSKTQTVKTFPSWWDHAKAHFSKKWRWWPWRKFRVEDVQVTMKFEANVFPELLFPDADIPFPARLGKGVKVTHYDADIHTSR